MTTRPSAAKSVFKHPLVVELIAVVVVAIIGSYLTILQASIPRPEVKQMIQDSEQRQTNAVDRLNDKQDQMLEKLEDLQLKVGIIGDRLGVKK